MKTLFLLMLIAVSALGANPPYTAFIGTNGILVRSNVSTGKILVDGAGIGVAGNNFDVQYNGGGVMAASDNFGFLPSAYLVRVIDPVNVGEVDIQGAGYIYQAVGGTRSLAFGIGAVTNLLIDPSGTIYVSPHVGGNPLFFQVASTNGKPVFSVKPIASLTALVGDALAVSDGIGSTNFMDAYSVGSVSGDFFLASSNGLPKWKLTSRGDLVPQISNIFDLASWAVPTRTNYANNHFSFGNSTMASATIGTTYVAQANAPPSSGLIVEGNVGIGGGTALAQLHVAGTVGGTGRRLLIAGTNILSGLIVTTNGNVAIGTNDTVSMLHVRGNTSTGTTFRMDDTNGTARVQMGAYISSPAYGGIWLGDVTPSSTNPTLLEDNGTSVYVNGSSSSTVVALAQAMSVKWQIVNGGALIPGADGLVNFGSAGVRPITAFLSNAVLSGTMAITNSLPGAAARPIFIAGTNNTGNGLTVTTNGTVGIGTSTPATTFDVSGNGAISGFWDFGSGRLNDSSGNTRFATGKVGIGLTVPGSLLEISNAAGTTVTPFLHIGTNLTSGFHVRTNGSPMTANGMFFPTNNTATFAIPTGAMLGQGGHWLGNSNGTLVSVYSVDGSTTAMKVLAP